MTSLALLMIVRDEAHTIARTLESAKPYVDRWLVLDTGSVDGTQDIVREVMAGVPGELHSTEWPNDYAAARNTAQDLVGTQTTHALWLDADDVLDGGELLRAFLPLVASCAQLCRIAPWGEVAWPTRVLRLGAGWRWRGGVHETLEHPTECVANLQGPVIRFEPGDIGLARSRARLPWDVEVLRGMLAENPSDERARMHLATTLRALAT